MSVDSFLDTNILVCAAAGQGDEEPKRRIALDLIDSETFGLSAQVLQEFYVTVTRKIQAPLPPAKALEWVEQFEAFPYLPIDTALVKIGAEISERYQISYWDGVILAAAQSLGAVRLYTEDLNHGQSYEGVEAINPFR